MGDTRYLVQHRRGWYCTVTVPPSLRAKLGRRLKRTLSTRDVHLARARRWAVIAELRAVIEQARTASPTTEALEFRKELDAARALGDDSADLVHPLSLVSSNIIERAYELERSAGPMAAQTFADVAFGRATPLATLVDQWLSDGSITGAPLKPRTQKQRRTMLGELLTWLDGERIPATAEAVTRRVAGRFVSERLLPSGRDPATLRNVTKALSALWTWMIRRGLHDGANVWAGQAPRKQAGDNGIEAERPFTRDEVRALLDGAPEESLREFIKVAALTGMRREEVGQLRVRDCRDGVFIVRSGKTAAAARRVPVHSALVSLVERRVQGQPDDAFLFPEIGPDAPERTQAIGQAFVALRRRLGLQAGSGRRSLTTLHSLRRFFVTEALNAGQQAHMVSLAVGHSEGRRGMTTGRYWGGADDEALRGVVEAVRLPEA